VVVVCALPIYHIFGLNTNLLLSMRIGGCNVLIANPRDLQSLFKDLKRQPFHVFPAVNTLFRAMLEHKLFGGINWNHLILSIGGGMAVQSSTALAWHQKTGCQIVEGYGLSETSPVICCNDTSGSRYIPGIGLPLPNTDVVLLGDNNQPVPPLSPGELAVKGPQVMQGYWQNPKETANTMTPDGFFKTGDIATMSESGHFQIVDRKKDMILVSGFNVYPTEIEEIVSQMQEVLECAAVGIPDEKSGEAIKLLVVRRDQTLSEQHVRRHCESRMTGYKRPKIIEFCETLPKTTVGKILRRQLRAPPP
jgi:long-chain acyl-CoA synthetase